MIRGRGISHFISNLLASSSSSPAPELLGPLYNFDNSGFDSGSFDSPVGSANFTFNSTYLSVSGGDGSTNNYMTYGHPTALETAKIRRRFKIKHVPGLNSYGLGLAFKSINSTSAISAYAYLVTSTGSLLGKAIINCDGVDNASDYNAQTPIPINQNDIILAEFERIPFGYRVTFTNETQSNAQVIGVLNCDTSNASNHPRPHNTSKIAIMPFGGSFEILEESYAPVNMYTQGIIIIQDSKCSYNASSQSQRAVDILVSNGHQAYATWGAGDKTVEAAQRTYELSFLQGRWCFINMVRNDLEAGVPDVTWQQNILDIHDDLEAGGATVYCVIPSCDGNVNVVPAKTFIEANIPNTIDMFTPTRLGPTDTDPDPTYIDTDETHYKPAAMALEASEMEAVI